MLFVNCIYTVFVCGGFRKCKMSGETPSWSHISCETFQQQPPKKAQHRTCKNTIWTYTRVKFIGHSKWAELKSYPLLIHSNEFCHWKPWFRKGHAKSKMTQHVTSQFLAQHWSRFPSDVLAMQGWYTYRYVHLFCDLFGSTARVNMHYSMFK